jgi:hypothetical protein
VPALKNPKLASLPEPVIIALHWIKFLVIIIILCIPLPTLPEGYHSQILEAQIEEQEEALDEVVKIYHHFLTKDAQRPETEEREEVHHIDVEGLLRHAEPSGSANLASTIARDRESVQGSHDDGGLQRRQRNAYQRSKRTRNIKLGLPNSPRTWNSDGEETPEYYRELANAGFGTATSSPEPINENDNSDDQKTIIHPTQIRVGQSQRSLGKGKAPETRE